MQPDLAHHLPSDIHRHQGKNCVANLIGENTGLLEGNVPKIFPELFDNYRAITPQLFTATKAKLETTTYNHA